MDTSTSPDSNFLHCALLLAGVSELLPGIVNAELQHDTGISQFAFFTLSELSKQPCHGMRLKELAACTNTTMARLSRVITQLESEHLVRKIKLDGPGRAVEIHISDEGKARLEHATVSFVSVMHSKVLADLNAEELQNLEKITTRLIATMHP
ncbi:MarR family winged helix-turn-helix transcriptional regulator [Bifidobacterium aquikefiricola]|uniref:HTH marR-type domain-containing protein n=2 Tax=Bifidobacterium TaxID=1678 RepID=A0AB39U6V9_9BIFI